MTSTRERKERFIKSFGDRAVRDAVLALFERHGFEILSDDHLAEAASELAVDAMSATKRSIRNRRIYRRQIGLAS